MIKVLGAAFEGKNNFGEYVVSLHIRSCDLMKLKTMPGNINQC